MRHLTTPDFVCYDDFVDWDNNFVYLWVWYYFVLWKTTFPQVVRGSIQYQNCSLSEFSTGLSLVVVFARVYKICPVENYLKPVENSYKPVENYHKPVENLIRLWKTCGKLFVYLWKTFIVLWKTISSLNSHTPGIVILHTLGIVSNNIN